MTRAMLPPLLLVGAGRMGGALFAGWVRQGLAPSVLVDPMPPVGLGREEDVLLPALDAVPGGFTPTAIILAVKPQMADAVLLRVGRLMRPGTVLLSIMAGRQLGAMAVRVGRQAAIVRAMPNTPAAIGEGISVACAGAEVSDEQRTLCSMLLEAVGDVTWVEDESLLDGVTAVSGSGPAYVFLLAELLEKAAIAEGLPPDLARKLARKTVAGAGALLASATEDAADLRRAVTSPNGTTQAALDILMAPGAWPDNLAAAVQAAARRSRELAG
jgi:pyrroline-5-carboxylate reductase